MVASSNTVRAFQKLYTLPHFTLQAAKGRNTALFALSSHSFTQENLKAYLPLPTPVYRSMRLFLLLLALGPFIVIPGRTTAVLGRG